MFIRHKLNIAKIVVARLNFRKILQLFTDWLLLFLNVGDG